MSNLVRNVPGLFSFDVVGGFEDRWPGKEHNPAQPCKGTKARISWQRFDFTSARFKLRIGSDVVRLIRY